MSVLGFLQMFSENSSTTDTPPPPGDGLLEFILLPYVALALSLIFILIFLLLEKCRNRLRNRSWKDHEQLG